MAIATKIGHGECQVKELLFHRLLRTNCVNNIKFQVLNQVFYYRYWSHVTVGQSILRAFQCFQHPLCTKRLNANLPLLEIRLGAISNCQLPITLEVIANDPITNYFTKKVMGNAPNYPLLFGYISN